MEKKRKKEINLEQSENIENFAEAAAIKQAKKSNSNQKGDIAEASAILLAMKQEWKVLKPFGHCSSYDLAFDIKGNLIRVQVKSAVKENSNFRTEIKRGQEIKVYPKNSFDFALLFVEEYQVFYFISEDLYRRYESYINEDGNQGANIYIYSQKDRKIETYEEISTTGNKIRFKEYKTKAEVIKQANLEEKLILLYIEECKLFYIMPKKIFEIWRDCKFDCEDTAKKMSTLNDEEGNVKWSYILQLAKGKEYNGDL